MSGLIGSVTGGKAELERQGARGRGARGTPAALRRGDLRPQWSRWRL